MLFRSKGEVRLGISATGVVFGKQVQFSGEFGGSAGLCLIGRMGDMPGDVPQASLFHEVQVAYTSERVLVNLPGGVPRNVDVVATQAQPQAGGR